MVSLVALVLAVFVSMKYAGVWLVSGLITCVIAGVLATIFRVFPEDEMPNMSMQKILTGKADFSDYFGVSLMLSVANVLRCFCSLTMPPITYWVLMFFVSFFFV